MKRNQTIEQIIRKYITSFDQAINLIAMRSYSLVARERLDHLFQLGINLPNNISSEHIGFLIGHSREHVQRIRHKNV